MKLIAQIIGLPRRGGRPTGLSFSLVSLHYLFTVATFAAATQHASDWPASSKRCFFFFFYLEVCSPPRECPGLGRLQRGGCWELGCVLDQGLNFPSEDEEKGLWHAPMRVFLLFEAAAVVAALISAKDYFISPCFFPSFLPFVFLLLLLRHRRCRCCGSLPRSSPSPSLPLISYSASFLGSPPLFSSHLLSLPFAS